MTNNKELNIFAKEQKLLIIGKSAYINAHYDLLKTIFKDITHHELVINSLSAFRKQNYDIILTYCDSVNSEIIDFIKNVRAVCHDKTIVVISNLQNNDIIKLIELDVSLLSNEDLNNDKIIEHLARRAKCVAMRKNFEIAKVYKVLELGTSQNKTDTCAIDDTFAFQVLQVAQGILEDINEKKSLVDVNDINFHNKDNSKCVQDFILSKTSCIEFDSYFSGIKLLTIAYEDIIKELKSNKLNSIILLEFANLYEKFSTIFFMLKDFDKLASVFLNLADLMYLIKAKRYKSSNSQKFALIIECIYQDISNFIDLIFIKQTAKDIYYLEDSLQSSIQQIKLNYNLIENKKNDNDDDELELF